MGETSLCGTSGTRLGALLWQRTPALTELRWVLRASIRVVPPSLRSLVGIEGSLFFAEVPLDTAKISAQAHSRSVKNVAVLRIFLRDT